ncbi:phage protein Gp36 family protein [Hydrocarboniphaga effusa]|uniref:phage protein Gp36 family protein n=1 Tax=Hydrocarboniphaga effusa TaxID=243629 RepID=UPI003BAD0B87
MPYATRQDLEKRYTVEEVAQLEASGRDIDQALIDADADIDSYLGTRYPLPIVGAVPERLVTAASDIARFRLYGISSDGEPLERYKLQLSWLRDVSKGLADVPGLIPRGDSLASVGPGNVRHGQAKSRFDWDAY